VSHLEAHTLSVQAAYDGVAAALAEEKASAEAARRQWAARLGALASTPREGWPPAVLALVEEAERRAADAAALAARPGEGAGRPGGRGEGRVGPRTA
jgi:hypothetical protein